MKNLLLIVSLLFIVSCQTNKVISTISKPILQEDNTTFSDNQSFNGIIEDFKHDLKYWNFASEMSLTKIKDGDKPIGVFQCSLPYSIEEYGNHVKQIRYFRTMNFSKFYGIKLVAKGTPGVIYKVKIYKPENYYPGHNTEEIWYAKFQVRTNWEEYKILFKEMEVEEFYEQDYISNNEQNFTNISGIGISAQNNREPTNFKGELYLEKIELF